MNIPSKRTTNYNLSQWEADDKVLRADFNADNLKLDAALAGKLGQPEIIYIIKSNGQSIGGFTVTYSNMEVVFYRRSLDLDDVPIGLDIADLDRVFAAVFRHFELIGYSVGTIAQSDNDIPAKHPVEPPAATGYSAVPSLSS